ncbi:hypothetical protein Y032_0136g1950 [Ancylostoma ceylanicum]|uniref:Myosin motor domain-containing protein n=1 Tax=Ancylostoma ceylanicum TaxID=53326 RepID=A0A016T5B9_9BILA|nr:hypothetical protein Y032_0136g1950 [Ancylostoma ceylanicum]
MDSPSRGCRANIFAMLANDLDEFDKEKYRISGFRLKEGQQGLGNVADLSSAFGELGISASDVFKVISACILLNNLSFKEIGGSIDIENLSDLEDASVLLGVSALAMYRAVMRCTLTGRDSIRECQSSRDQLVSALYTRVVRRILMRANACLDNLQDLTGSSDIIGSETRFIHVVDSPGYVCNKTNSLSELLINTVNDSLAGYSTEKASDLLQRIELSNKVCGSSSMRRIQESCVSKQISLFRATPPCESYVESSWAPLPEFPSAPAVQPAVPSPRRYEVRERKKHVFPQRRNVIVDFHDQNSGAVLRAGDVVKAMGFVGDAYVVETGRRIKAVIPISYTEKSLPPTEGYNV